MSATVLDCGFLFAEESIRLLGIPLDEGVGGRWSRCNSSEPMTTTASCAYVAHGCELIPTHDWTCVRLIPWDNAKSGLFAFVTSGQPQPDPEMQSRSGKINSLHQCSMAPLVMFMSPAIIHGIDALVCRAPVLAFTYAVLHIFCTQSFLLVVRPF